MHDLLERARVSRMSEQGDALDDLSRAGVLAGICWAWDSTVRKVLSDYEPATGHDQGWLGYTAHKIFRDRLDRVASCDRFGLEDNADPSSGVDVVREGLSSDDIDTMPLLAPGLVRRADLNGSPGWRHGEWRWLLASYTHGKSDRIPWPQRSPTKLRVAAQPSPDDLALFEIEEVVSLDEVALQVAKASTLDLTTLVVAHAIDGTTGQPELYFGRTKLNPGGGYAWHWKVNLASPPPGGEGSRSATPQRPGGPDPNALPDAPVKMRPGSAEPTRREGSR
jgi:hypothetical protein